MGSEYGFKVDGWGSSWSGSDQLAEGRRVARLAKLKALLDALKSGDLEGSQKAINDLWNFDATLKLDPYLIKIANALSKKLMHEAQKTAMAMQADSHHFASHVPFKPHMNTSVNPNAHPSVHASVPGVASIKTQAHLDPAPRKATEGEFGRIIDVSA
jgi:hypothetical protein